MVDFYCTCSHVRLSVHFVRCYASALAAGGFICCTTPAVLQQLMHSCSTRVSQLQRATSGFHIIISFMKCLSTFHHHFSLPHHIISLRIITHLSYVLSPHGSSLHHLIS
jgi:hypothetical protein